MNQQQKQLEKKNKKDKNEEKYYKNRYHIVFYAEDDETYVIGFNTAAEICKYLGRKFTPANRRYINVLLYQALKRDGHKTRMLDGTPMHVYLVDMIEDEDF